MSDTITVTIEEFKLYMARIAELEAERNALLAEQRDEWNFRFVEEMKAKCNSCTLVERLGAERDDASAREEARRLAELAMGAHCLICAWMDSWDKSNHYDMPSKERP